MDNKIVMIKTSQLLHHPENPRRDVGDITELTESIKLKGILQNLTVVPAENKKGIKTLPMYWVVIGNRRLSAGTQAGLEEFPCVISDMSHAEQMETMLVENMQRSDLTVIEEAWGIGQLMLEGFSEEDVCKTTGLSKSTVRRRTSLNQFPEKKVEAAINRGAPLEDFTRLLQIKDEKKRNELMEYLGKSNFEWKFSEAKEEEKAQRTFERLKKAGLVEKLLVNDVRPRGYRNLGMEPGYKFSYDLCEANMLQTIQDINWDYIHDNFEDWTWICNREGGKYLYLYVKDKPKEKTEEETAEEQKLEERRQNAEALEELHKRFKAKRLLFIKQRYKSNRFLPEEKEGGILFAFTNFMETDFGSWRYEDLFEEITGINIECDLYLRFPDEEGSEGERIRIPQQDCYRTLMAYEYAKLESEDYHTKFHYRDGSMTGQYSAVSNSGHDSREYLLELLDALNYEYDEEEKAYYDGTHALFVKAEAEE